MKVVVIGAAGHASDVVSGLEALATAAPGSLEIVGVLADDRPDPARFGHRAIEWLGPVEELPDVDATHFVLGIGWPWVRRSVFEQLKGVDQLEAAAVVHPRAVLGIDVTVGGGTVVLDNAHLSATSRVGEHSYVGYLSAVGHDSVLGDFVSVMPGAILSGNVVVGDGAMIGTGAVIREGVTVGSDARVGAGAVVLDDVAPGATVVGNPARLLVDRD